MSGDIGELLMGGCETRGVTRGVTVFHSAQMSWTGR